MTFWLGLAKVFSLCWQCAHLFWQKDVPKMLVLVDQRDPWGWIEDNRLGFSDLTSMIIDAIKKGFLHPFDFAQGRLWSK